MLLVCTNTFTYKLMYFSYLLVYNSLRDSYQRLKTARDTSYSKILLEMHLNLQKQTFQLLF